MKTIPIALAAHNQQTNTTLAKCLKITRSDGLTFGYTEHDQKIQVGGTVYEPGFEPSELVSNAGLSVDNLEVTIFPDEEPGGAVTREDLVSGLWNNSTFQIFELNYESPSDGITPMKSGTLGEIQLRRGNFVVEFRGITQAMQQSVGIVTSKTCRANFADFPAQRLSSPCRLDVADWTVTGAITAVTDNQVFTDSSRTEADEWFQEGILTWTSGTNEGVAYRQKVKAFSGGQITLSLPAPFSVQVGDTYSMVAGCQKRHDVDCRDKFSNILNFQGEPHLVGIDAITAAPEAAG